METTKVIAWVDIQAPLHEVFETILHAERRMQLSPMWGATSLEQVDENYPAEGSSLLLKLIGEPGTEYQSIVTRLEPLKVFSYRLTVDRNTVVTWRTQDVSSGTRLTYEEEFTVEQEEKDAFCQSVNEVANNWLANIKRYTELSDGRGRRLFKRLIDRFFLPMRSDQRKTVLLILFMHFVGMIASVMAIVIWGIAFALQ